MASLAGQPPLPYANDERFFLRSAIVFTAVVVGGFTNQLAMGRSTFASPWPVHFHAIVFMGWVAIYLTQNVLVGTGRVALHRRLGWIAVVWVPLMVVLGLAVTIAMVRRGQVPFIFRPVHFLIFDPVNILTFAGLTTAAIVMRRRTDWHRRLHYCGMSSLIGPAFGRLLPMPLLQPLAWETAFGVTLVFPIVGMWLDARRNGRAHSAWKWGLATMLASFVLTEALTYSPLGLSIYDAVTSGSRGATVPPLDFPPKPDGSLMTGRT